MPPAFTARPPIPEEVKNVYLIDAIESAPDSTVRTVLRALCADKKLKLRIRTLMFHKKLPLISKPDANTTTKTELCIQCDELFDVKDKSKTCRHHLCKYRPQSLPHS